jgi:hypothetical protein
MITPEPTNTNRVDLEKLKAYLQRSNLEYTEERQGNSTVMEIKRKVKDEAFDSGTHSHKREDPSS